MLLSGEQAFFRRVCKPLIQDLDETVLFDDVTAGRLRSGGYVETVCDAEQGIKHRLSLRVCRSLGH